MRTKKNKYFESSKNKTQVAVRIFLVLLLTFAVFYFLWSLMQYNEAMEKKEETVRLLEKVNKIFADNNIPTLEGIALRGGSDAAYVTQYGIPCLDSLGVEGGFSHSVKEYAKIQSLSESAKRIASIIFFI